MPVHDWTRVSAGTFHDFHNAWITHLKEALNDGLLPPQFYAQSEQHARDVIPDVLALHTESAAGDDRSQDGSSPDFSGGSAVAVADAPPDVSRVMTVEGDDAVVYTTLRKSLVIRHASGHRIVALIEIVSPGNKSSPDKLDEFLDKAVIALKQGYHLLILDLFAPGRFDPGGIHDALWSRLLGRHVELPADRPLTLVSYVADTPPTAYVEQLAVGSTLPAMPLFLDPGWYVHVPLEQTYTQAWRGVPRHWREVIESGEASPSVNGAS